MIDPQQQKLQSVVMGQMPGAGNQQQQQPAAGSLQFMDSSSYGNYAQQPQAGGGPGYYSQPTDFSGTIGGGAGATNFDDEPSLLEELGIDFHKIYERTVSVLNPMKKVTKDMLYSIGHDGQQSADSDMAGPLIIGLMLGGAMLLRGKVSFLARPRCLWSQHRFDSASNGFSSRVGSLACAVVSRTVFVVTVS